MLKKEHLEELNTVLTHEMPEGKIIKTCLSGSYAYGTNNENSDIDIRGVYVLPERSYLGFENPNLEYEPDGFEDCKFFEIKKFLMLCLKGNPHQLEILFTESQKQDPLWILVDRVKSDILGKKPISDAYLGFARAEHHAVLKDANPQRALKRWKHIFRLLSQGTALLATGEMSVRLSDNMIVFLETIMSGEHTLESLEGMFEHNYSVFEKVYETSKLPDFGNAHKVEAAMRDIRTNVK